MNRAGARAAAGGLVLLAAAMPVAAQQAPARADSGARVRIVATSFYPPVVGRVTRVGPDTLFVRSATRVHPDVAVPLDSITDLQLSMGRSRQRGAVRWGVSGFLLGALTGLTMGSADVPGASSGGRSGSEVLRLGAYGAGAGALLGALAGALHGGERWQPIPVPGRQAPR